MRLGNATLPLRGNNKSRGFRRSSMRTNCLSSVPPFETYGSLHHLAKAKSNWFYELMNRFLSVNFFVSNSLLAALRSAGVKSSLMKGVDSVVVWGSINRNWFTQEHRGFFPAGALHHQVSTRPAEVYEHRISSHPA